MTSTTEHPDVERLRKVLEARHVDDMTIDALSQLVYPGAIRPLVRNYVDAVFEYTKAQPIGEAIEKAFINGFMTGIEFQAAGGHREVGST